MESSIWLWDYGSYLCCEFVFAVSFVVLLYVWSAAFFLHILSFLREGTSGTDMIAEAYRQTFLNYYSFCIPRQQDGTIPIQVFFAFVVFNGASTGIDPPYSSSTFSTTCDTLMVFQGTYAFNTRHPRNCKKRTVFVASKQPAHSRKGGELTDGSSLNHKVIPDH